MRQCLWQQTKLQLLPQAIVVAVFALLSMDEGRQKVAIERLERRSYFLLRFWLLDLHLNTDGTHSNDYVKPV